MYYYNLECKFCYDQVLYAFNDKYEQLNNDIFNNFIKSYKYDNNNIILNDIIKKFK